ncbi:hypothetical protein SH661x_002426 [Planctomicrobium sp. SH661]|uniref:hypothetical protein n=1 Tax=Planctomicrobium sp. SH661 TaxID=3448124 RepID=UPI003F5B1725
MRSPVLKQNLLWLGASVLAVGVLSVTASYVPTEMKRLFLFHAIYGIACGLVLLWLRGEIRPTWQRSLPAWGAVLCLLGAVNMGWLSYRHFQHARAEYAAAHPRDAALQSMLEQISVNDPEIKARYEEEQRRLHPRFVDFLVHRTSGLGEWKSPWPVVMWVGEVLLAGICCGATMWLKRDQLRPQTESG